MSRPPVLRIWQDGLIVDSFAGGGGASVGIERALGRSPDIAVNHDPEAIAMHRANHPGTRHLISNVKDVDIVRVCGGRPIELLWLSPDCTFHSKARGGKPHRDRDRARRTRGLANIAVKWAAKLGNRKPRVITLENVEEFADWGPLQDDGTPCPIRKGASFRRFVKALQNLGYAVDWQEIRACDHGAPTTRNRLFLVARCDGQPIEWPEPTHGYARLPYRSAAECIDWGIRCPSIFERARPLAENTMRRIARGIWKYVINCPEPFIVGLAHGEHARGAGSRSHGLDEPLRTIHAGGNNFALVSPIIVGAGGPAYSGKPVSGGAPFGTLTTENHRAVVATFLAKHYGGHETPGSAMPRPFDTITARDHHALVASTLVNLRGTHDSQLRGRSITDPLPTISSGGIHAAQVCAFLARYNGSSIGQSVRGPISTIDTTDRFALVTVHGERYAIVDIGMRMLEPRELFNAQGFPENYEITPIIERILRGKPHVGPLPKDGQVRMCGNSVSPPPAEATIRANLPHIAAEIAA